MEASEIFMKNLNSCLIYIDIGKHLYEDEYLKPDLDERFIFSEKLNIVK